MVYCVFDINFSLLRQYGQRFTHLIKHGTINLAQPSCSGKMSKLPPGMIMQKDSQISPMTLANDVNISASTMSQKYVGMLTGLAKHRFTALRTKCIVSFVPNRNVDRNYAQQEAVSFVSLKHIKWTDEEHDDHKPKHGWHELIVVNQGGVIVS